MDKTETVAELQARNKTLEQKVAELKAKDDAISKAELRAVNAELREIQSAIKLAEQEEKFQLMAKEETKRKEGDAERAVQQMVSNGTIATRDTELQATYKAKFVADPTLIPLMASKLGHVGGGNGNGKVTPNGTALVPETEGQAYEFGNGWDAKKAFQTFYRLISRNAAIKVNKFIENSDRSERYQKKGMMALDAANFFNRELLPRLKDWENIPINELGKLAGCVKIGNDGSLQAADVTQATADSAGHALDPTNTLGTLSGTLVLQRTLPFFKYKYPELMMLYTDFSDTPGLYEQTEQTRIISQLATQKYNAQADSAGRPKGWDTVSPAVSTDAPITLTDYIGVPIVFGQSALAATTRRLFDEQAVLAVAAIADYFTAMLTALATAGNYNGYAVQNGTFVPIAYATYARGLQEFAMSDLDALDAAFTSNKVPEDNRGIFLTPSYYAKLRGDMRLLLNYAATGGKTIDGASEFITEARLPKLSGFAPIKAPYFPQTNNRVGFAFQKSAAILKSRLPMDFTQALGVMVPGSVTTVTDPDTKISVMLVQYVHLTQGYAEWRPEVILGAAVGDKRGGLVLTSQ